MKELLIGLMVFITMPLWLPFLVIGFLGVSFWTLGRTITHGVDEEGFLK